MKRPADSSGMPLKIWVVAFSLALGILAGIWQIYEVRDQKVGALRPRVIQKASAPKDSIEAYFLGSSLTRYALLEYQTMDSLLAGNVFHYKVVTGMGTNLSAFNSCLGEIKALRPKHLFIESNVATLNYQGNSRKAWQYALSRFRTRLARIPVYLTKMKGGALELLDRNVPEPFSNKFKTKLDFDFIDERNLELRGQVLTVRKINDFPEWVRFFKDADSLGIHIFLLEIPRSREAEKHLPPELKQQYKALIDLFNNAYGISYLDFPEELGYVEFYHDRAHLNRAGSFYYVDWLLRELKSRQIILESK